MLKRFIRYLYEYENGRRMRNVGFVKVDQSDGECIVHIHGKGLRLEGEKELTIYLFYEKEKECIGLPQGTVDNVNPAVNYQLRYTKEDVGEPCNYDIIEGIIMENSSHRKYAAVWDDMPVNVNEMRLWTPADLTQGTEPEEIQEEPVEPEEEQEEPVEPEEIPEERVEPEEPEEVMEEEPLEPEEPDMNNGMKELTPEEPPAGEMLPKEDADSGVIEEQEVSAEPVRSEPDCQKQGKKCTKIQRQDIVNLPRCEWRLSNNSFLLHGYYNYRHLVVIEEDGNVWLGVPGIYHPKEARAAEAFGFPQFIKIEKVDVDLDEEERNDGEEFGYWCRHIRR